MIKKLHAEACVWYYQTEHKTCEKMFEDISEEIRKNLSTKERATKMLNDTEEFWLWLELELIFLE